MSKKIEFLEGQVLALIGVCAALINDHPNPASLSRWIDVAEQATLASVASTPALPEFLDGVRDVMGRLKKAVANAQTRQTRSD